MFSSQVSDIENLKARVTDALVMVTKKILEIIQQETVHSLNVLCTIHETSG